MKKTCFIFILCLLFPGAVFAEEEAENEALDIKIEGETRDRVDIGKADSEIIIDYEEIIPAEVEKIDKLLNGWDEVLYEKDFEKFAEIPQEHSLRPQIRDIPRPPMIEFYPDISGIDFDSWQISVISQEGGVIKTVRGKERPGRVIEWDGRDEEGNMIKAGWNYSYSFRGVDKGDNTHVVVGKSFQLDALRYRKKRDFYVEIWNNHLYERDEAKFRDEAEMNLEKTLDIIRKYSASPFEVNVYTDSPTSRLSEERVELIKSYLADKLPLLEQDIDIVLHRSQDRGNITSVNIKL
ncbi:MAG: hypothetical protein ACQESB_04535 [Elusimicrobiota bacterium]